MTTVQVTVRVEPTAVVLACHACGAHGVVTRETGDITDRIRGFACSHLDPHALAVRVTVNGRDMGWTATT